MMKNKDITIEEAVKELIGLFPIKIIIIVPVRLVSLSAHGVLQLRVIELVIINVRTI